MGYERSFAHEFLKAPDSIHRQAYEIWKMKRDKEYNRRQSSLPPPEIDKGASSEDASKETDKTTGRGKANIMLFVIFAILAAILIYAIHRGLREDPSQANAGILREDGSIDINRFFQTPSIKTVKSVGKWVSILMAVSLILWALGYVINQVKDLEKKVAG